MKINLSGYTEAALTLSTHHISQETARWLDKVINGVQYTNLVVYDKPDYGWFIATGECDDEVPADLSFLIGIAMGSGHDWLQLDCDAQHHDELPYFDW